MKPNVDPSCRLLALGGIRISFNVGRDNVCVALWCIQSGPRRIPDYYVAFLDVS